MCRLRHNLCAHVEVMRFIKDKESANTKKVAASDMSDEEAVKLAIQRNDEIERGKEIPVTHKELMDRFRRDEN